MNIDTGEKRERRSRKGWKVPLSSCAKLKLAISSRFTHQNSQRLFFVVEVCESQKGFEQISGCYGEISVGMGILLVRNSREEVETAAPSHRPTLAPHVRPQWFRRVPTACPNTQRPTKIHTLSYPLAHRTHKRTDPAPRQKRLPRSHTVLTKSTHPPDSAHSPHVSHCTPRRWNSTNALDVPGQGSSHK
jgi:hypothetical protein